MTMNKKDIFVNRNHYGKMYEVALFEEGNGNVSMASGITMRPYTDGDMGQPFATFKEDEMQSLFQQLWNLGFRPLDGTGNAGHIAALKDHLEDMRSLVFNKKE